MESIHVKNELIAEFLDAITPSIYQGFLSLYDGAMKYNERVHHDKSQIMEIFQDLLRVIIPKWNSTTIKDEVRRIKIQSKKDDTLEKYLTTIVKISYDIMEVETEVSIDFNAFIHACYIQTAKEIYNNPYIFYHLVPEIEKRKNQEEAIQIVRNSIQYCIRKEINYDMYVDKFNELYSQKESSLSEETNTNNDMSFVSQNRIDNSGDKKLSELQEVSISLLNKNGGVISQSKQNELMQYQRTKSSSAAKPITSMNTSKLISEAAKVNHSENNSVLNQIDKKNNNVIDTESFIGVFDNTNIKS